MKRPAEDDGRVGEREVADAGQGEQGHAQGGEDRGGELDPGLTLEVDGAAEEGLADGGGDAVGGDEAAA